MTFSTPTPDNTQYKKAPTFAVGCESSEQPWLHDLLKPHVSRLVVCDPRKNALLKDGNKNDRIDARKLAELLRTNQVKAVHHGNHGTRALKELGRSYMTITKDATRVMNRIKSVYRSWGFPVPGRVSTLVVIVPSGWPSWWNQGYGFEPSIYTSNWTVCNHYVWKPAASCCWKVASMQR